MKCRNGLLLCLFTLLLSPPVLWSQSSSSPDSSRIITISYSDWMRQKEISEAQDKLNRELTNELMLSNVEMQNLKKQVTNWQSKYEKLLQDFKDGKIDIEELRKSLTEVENFLKSAEESLNGSKKKIISLQVERDIALVGCGVLAVAVVVVTIIALTK
jgi:septal ring factor EnvC (AmiA/AmiB activator)